MNMRKYFIAGLVIGLGLLGGAGIAFAAAFLVAQGGTSQSTFTQGILYSPGGTNPFQTIATTTASCSGSTTCTSFTVFGSSPITISSSGGGGGSGNVSTSTHETAGGIAYWTSNSATPALLGEVATSTITPSSPLTGSFVALGGSIGIQQANGSQSGYLSNTDWTTFNNKQYSFSTSTLSASSPLTGSFIQIGSGGSLGCQTASGSQTGCLSSTDWTTFNNKGSGTIISIATNNGITGGTITTTGTLSLDQTFGAIWTAASTTYTQHLALNTASTTQFTAPTLWTDLTAYNLLTTDVNGKMVASSTIADNFLPTNLTGGSCISCNLSYNAQGFLTAAANGSSGGISWPWNLLTNYGTTTNATTTPYWAQEGVYASSTSYFVNAYFNNSSSTLGTLGNGQAQIFAGTGSNIIFGQSGGASPNIVIYGEDGPPTWHTLTLENTYVSGTNKIINFPNDNGIFTLGTGINGDCAQWTDTNTITATSGACGTGTVTSVTASSPLTGGTITTSGNIGIQAASASQSGYLSAADYSLINTATSTFSAPLVYTRSTNAVTCPTCNISSASVTSVGFSTPNSTLTLGGTNPVTTSGTISADLNLAHTNWWTSLQNFTNATTSGLEATSTNIFFDGPAAGSILATNANHQLVATTTIANTLLQLSGVSTGSYTDTNLTVNAWGIVTAASNGTAGTGGGQLLATFATSTAGNNVSVNFGGAAGSNPSFSAGALTLPSNTSYIVVQAFGGGGGGGGGATGAGGGGGGGGGFSQKLITNPSGTYYYSVGLGGGGGSATNAGSAGSNSCFQSTNSTCSSGTINVVGNGGGGADGSSVTGNAGPGGTGTGGDLNLTGSAGSPGNNNAYNGVGGSGGSGGYGGGGGGGLNGLGTNGSPFGGGASGGGGGSESGGAGGTGGIVIYVYTTGISNGSVGSGTTGQFAFYNAVGTNLSATSTIFVSAASNVGVGTTTPWADLLVSANNGAPGGRIFAVASSTATTMITPFSVDSSGWIVTSGVKPTASSCGSTNSVSGNQTDGDVMFTGTLVTACTINFPQPVPSGTTLQCTESDNSLAATGDISATTTSSVTFGLSAGVSSGTIWWRCDASLNSNQ